MPYRNHLSICICSYKRPVLLEQLLVTLQNQITENLFSFSIIIIDNDYRKSAKRTVMRIAEKSLLSINYYCEPQKNISLARNKAIRESNGDFVVFIDDDELPVTDWLLHLYNTQCKYSADGVLGPVKPSFEVQPPKWVIEGKLWDRKSFVTGTIFKSSKDTRTGNVLLARDIFDDNEKPFDPNFGISGGEDTDFFQRMLAKEKKIVWCNEACVYENIPKERLTRSYFLKRAFNRGASTAKAIRFMSFSTIKSILAIILYTLALPFFALIGQHALMDYLIRECDHVGKLLAYIGIKPLNDRGSLEKL